MLLVTLGARLEIKIDPLPVSCASVAKDCCGLTPLDDVQLASDKTESNEKEKRIFDLFFIA